MTVKSLNSHEKQAIATAFLAKTQTIDEMVLQYRRSRRTIIRALEEQDIDPGIRKRQPRETRKTQQLPIVIHTKTPWYRRLAQSMGALFA